MFTPTSTLDWGAAVDGSVTGSNLGGLGPASSSGAGGVYPEPAGTALNAAIGGNAFTISSNGELQRAENTTQAWNGNAWVPVETMDSTNVYFAGHFGAPSAQSPSGYGDDLLGGLAQNPVSIGSPEITLTFSLPLSYIEFEVSSAQNPDFTAQLIARDSLGKAIGTYQIQDTGGGGFCAGLSASSGSTPCNDAPLIQFSDPTGSIKSVELIMVDDLSGVYVDQLGASEGFGSLLTNFQTPAPEPGSFGLLGAGLASLLWLRTRRRRAARHSAARIG